MLPEIAALGEEFGVPVFRCPLITGDFVNAATLTMEELQAPRPLRAQNGLVWVGKELIKGGS